LLHDSAVIVYELNVCVQNRYVRLQKTWCDPPTLKRNYMCFSVSCMSAGSHVRKRKEAPARLRAGATEADGYLLLRPDVDTAVYVDGLACDVVPVFHQVADCSGDLFRLPEASEGDLFA
jgi:hypothetical protein